MTNHAPIRIAILGAGIFARNVHAPTLLELSDRYEIVAVYNRRRESARPLAHQLAEALGEEPRIYDDLNSLLARDDLDAVDIVQPIAVMPDTVRRALAAGKHVISEKPAAPDVATGRQLLADAAPYMDAGQVWMVAENWRYESAYVEAKNVVANLISHRPMVFHWARYSDFPNNVYYQTEWRRNESYPGGLVLDGGVHFVAALRHILGPITEVRASAAALNPNIPPVDTVSATLTFANGTVGTLIMCWAHGMPWEEPLNISSEMGALRVEFGRLELATGGATNTQELPHRDGVRREFEAFADAIQHGTPHRNSPAEAVQDVAVIEALLRAAETGQPVQPARIVE